MKKMKLLAPIMASVAIASPMMVALTSCHRVDYSELISEFKDKAISTFMDLTRTTHRSPWVEGECYNYIKRKMSDFDIDPVGGDRWCDVGEVAAKIAAQKKLWEDAGIKTESAFQSYGNIWFDLPATKGMEDVPGIIIQAHMDVSMAFDTDSEKITWAKATKNIIDVTYDRDKELIYTNGKASLGADAGLGIAAMLTLAELQTKFKHGRIRLLFTAGESEGTKTYASGADYLLNDQCYEGKEWTDRSKKIAGGTAHLLEANQKKPFGDKKGEFPFILSTSGIYKNFLYSSCGGIHQCQFTGKGLVLKDETANKIDWSKSSQLHLFTLTIDGLHGGQSAKYINSGYANALQMLMRMLPASDSKDFHLINATSEPGAYAISSKASATFFTQIDESKLKEKCQLVIKTMKNAFPNENWDKFSWDLVEEKDQTKKQANKYWLSTEQTSEVVKLFAWVLMYGPTDWFDKEHKSVRTSCNFGNLSLYVDQSEDQTKESTFSVYNVCRSADQPSLELFYNVSHALMRDSLKFLYKDEVIPEDAIEHNDKPVWEKRDDNKMVKALSDGYKNMSIKPSTWDNHGWLEISCFLEAYETAKYDRPHMSCIGPEIRNSHEVDEEVWTDTLNTCLGAMIYAIEHINNYKPN